MKKLLQLRLAKGWSQNRLSEEAGLSQTYISYLEAGTKSPTIKTLEKIAQALGVSISALLEEDFNSNPSA